MLENLSEIINQFDIPGSCLSVAPLKKGHINDTYVSTWQVADRTETFVHQRINHRVFRYIPELMENIVKITAHIAQQIAELEDETTLQLVPCKRGKWFLVDSAGNYWRTYSYISNSESYYVCSNAAQAKEAARTCGRFQSYINELDPANFFTTIPEFHNTMLRYRALEEAVVRDSENRVASARDAIDFALARREQAGIVVHALKNGSIPTRVTHNDLKFNNVMFDKETGKGIAVVDLDTCMPGSILYDFGDLVRNTSVPANEDETDLSRVYMDISFFRALAEGYFEPIHAHVTAAEWELVAFAPRLMTLTIGVRFLTDYLQGDTYFKTEYATHNLDRARNQFKIVESMEAQAGEMEAIVRQVRENAPGGTH